MTTFEPGTPVWHPEHGFGISYKNPSRSEAVCYANEVGDYAVSLYLDGWERARIAGPGEVIVKVDDLDLSEWGRKSEGAVLLDGSPIYGQGMRAAIRAANAWAELQKDASETPVDFQRENDAENETAESPKKSQQPKRVKDKKGRVWDLENDGFWFCKDVATRQPYEIIEERFSPLTVLDHEPEQSIVTSNSGGVITINETGRTLGGDVATFSHPDVEGYRWHCTLDGEWRRKDCGVAMANHFMVDYGAWAETLCPDGVLTRQPEMKPQPIAMEEPENVTSRVTYKHPAMNLAERLVKVGAWDPHRWFSIDTFAVYTWEEIASYVTEGWDSEAS